MSEPIKIRFATDHAGAKAGVQDLAASVVSNLVKVSDAMNTGAQANGGYLATVRRLAAGVGNDFASIGAAGLKAANDSNYSAVATTAAIAKAAAATEAGAVVAKGGYAVLSESAKFHYGIIRNEATQTAKLLIQSPLAFGATAIAGVVAVKLAYEFLAASARAASEALDDTAKVGSDASRLGVSTTFLQTYRAQARDLKVEVADLTKSLEMARDAFTMKLGEGGEGARNDSAFGARLRQQAASGNVNKDQLARYDAASGTEAKFRVALDIMAELQAKARDLAALDLASRLFPPEIVERIRAGTIELDRFRKTMDDVKNPDLVLLKPDEIARAQELQRRLEAAQATLDKAGREFRHELAIAGEGLKADAIAWQELMAKGATFAVGLLKQARQYVEAEEANRPAIYGRDYFRDEDKPKSGLARDVGKPASLPSSGDADRDNALNRLRGNLGDKTLVGQAQAASRSMTDGFRGDGGPRRDRSNPIVSGSRSSGGNSIDAVESFINGLEKTAAAAKAEAEAFALSNTEKAASIALAKLKETADQNGITLTEEQIAKTRAAAEANARYRDTIVDLEQAQQQSAELQRTFGNTAVDGIMDFATEGRKAIDILSDMNKMIARMILQALLLGSGPLGGLFGTAPAASAGGSAVGGLFGIAGSMFRANGGPVQAGQAYTVGELGQEIFVPNSDGRMVPVARGGGAGGSGGGRMALTVDVRGATGNEEIMSMVQAGVSAGIRAYDGQLDRGLSGRVDRARMRFGGV